LTKKNFQKHVNYITTYTQSRRGWWRKSMRLGEFVRACRGAYWI